jgi:hypothetical protein
MTTTERRTAARVNPRIPLRFRPISTPPTPEQRAESVNLSPHGVYFSPDFPLTVGAPVELFLKMPSELTGKTPTELRCTARVIHIQPDNLVTGKLGVGVHIERTEALKSPERWAS